MITGKRLGQSGLFRNVLRFVGDIIRFNQKLSRNSIVLINTSMRFKSVMRDMLFVHVCRVRRKKAVVFIHGWDWSFVNKMQQLAPGFIRFALLKTEAVIVLASEFESALCKQGFKGKVYRLSTFVNDDETADWDEQRIRETAGSPGLRILFMARLEPGKGLFPALDAVKQLQYSHPDVQLNVAGIGSQLTAAQQHAQTQSVPARFHGFVQGEDKKRLMQKADVLLLPTTYGEGMPTAVLEGMAFGCAVVTCPAGGIKDFFQHGKMGFLCDEPHPDILCSYLKQLTDDQALRIRMGLFNFDYVKQHFTADRVLNQLESILRQTGQSKTTERL
ncbi:MAG: glycosyltransferase family 4 protein [candidate division KSB1 bacterium]|nr:glycosyltransferase family 4 protein [candidate division KSB1 bacterium]